jgi:hypothetical protein
MGGISSRVLRCNLKGLKLALVNLKGQHSLCPACLSSNTSCPVTQRTLLLTPLFDLVGS